MPVLPETESQQAITPAPPTSTPIPASSSVCKKGTKEVVYVWGVSFCVPVGWTLEQEIVGSDYRTAWMTKDEITQDTSLYAITLMEGSPNAPLSYSMRQAKKAVSSEISDLIPGGLEDPETWEPVTSFSVDDNEGQMSETTTTYRKTGNLARVRVIVFNHGEQRWRIVIVAPQELWQEYDTTVFPYITKTLDVY